VLPGATRAVNLTPARFSEQNENMLASPERLVKLIEGMESRVSTGFRVSADTAPVIVEALRLYARMHAIEHANFRVEKWDWRNQHIEEIVSSTSLLLIGRAAFDAAREQYPGAQLTLRQGIRVILKWPE
jgi:hypothetical protein